MNRKSHNKGEKFPPEPLTRDEVIATIRGTICAWTGVVHVVSDCGTNEIPTIQAKWGTT